MSLLLLVAITALCFSLAVIFLQTWAEYDLWQPSVFFASLFVILLTWFIVFQCQDWRVDKVSTLYSYEDNGRQVVSYKHDENQIILINLNEKFKKNIKNGTPIKMVEYSDGPYAGIYLSRTIFGKRKDFQLEE